MSAPDIVGPGESGPYVPGFRGVLPGGMSGFGAESVDVDDREKWCQASLLVPGAADLTSVDGVALLDWYHDHVCSDREQAASGVS